MENSQKTIMFIYGNFYIGGIENYLIRLIRKLKANGNRIIWLTPFDTFIDEILISDLLDGYVERINVGLNDFTQINNAAIAFSEGEEVIALAFEITTFIQVEILKRKYRNTRIDSFYWVSHFKSVFLEEMLAKPLQIIARKFIGKIIYAIEQNDNIIYVCSSHADAFTRTYNYKIVNLEKKILGSTREIDPYDEKLAFRRSIRSEFNIITVGRFDFPHKAYLLGLIRAYGKLKAKYGQIKLTIIGYGKDESKVIEEIDKLSINAQKGISFVGKVPYDGLRRYFENAHLNIGVAGTISDGALTGLISIPVRHYSDTCEGYGYLPESRQRTVSIEPGAPIEMYIEEVVTMGQEKYQDLSKKAYDTYASDNITTILSLLDCKNKDPKRTVSYFVIATFKMARALRRIICNFKKCKSAKKQGNNSDE